MGDDTLLMIASIFVLVLLNSFVFLYNQDPITTASMEGFNVNETDFIQNINQTANEEADFGVFNGLSVIWSFITFLFNIVIMLVGWYSTYPFIINIIIKFFAWILALTFLVTLLRLIRGN